MRQISECALLDKRRFVRILNRMSEHRIQSGIDALRAGKRRDARRIFSDVVRSQPDNAEAWWYLSAVVDDPDQKAQCLRQVLRLEPKHDEARGLLNTLEGRLATVTPPHGVPRPILEVTEADGKLILEDGANAPIESDASENRDMLIMVISVVIALLAIGGTVIAIVTGFATEQLGFRALDAGPTLIPLSFGEPACLVSSDSRTQLLFINNTAVAVDLLRGAQGQEEYLLTIRAGEQQAVETAAALEIRYAVRTPDPSYASGAARYNVPAKNTCRVPIN
jgi:hypothetical protein